MGWSKSNMAFFLILAYIAAFFGIFSSSIFLLTFYENKKTIKN